MQALDPQTASRPLAGAARQRFGNRWPDALLPEYLDAAAEVVPDRPAVVDGDVRLTYAELAARVSGAARALAQLGVGPGDVVSWQLPNWWEAVVVHHAAIRLRAVSNPLVTILRERELGFILRQARSRVLVVPSTFRRFDFAAMAGALARDLPDLEHVLTVRGGAGSFDAALAGRAGAPASPGADPDDVVLLLYTSGTEADPKGVLHSHNTLAHEIASVVAHWSLRSDDVVFMPSPVGHISGVLYGLHLPAFLRTGVVFQDVWQPAAALELVERERCTMTVAATPFLHGMIHDETLAARDVSSLRLFACGGADVSPAIVREGTARLDATVLRVYGSTEVPTVTSGAPGDPEDRQQTTDGRRIGAAEVRVVDGEGRDAAPGEPGDLLVRAPEAFLGYLDPAATERSFEPDGWFRTGDLATLDADGYVTITGRSKDIIVRGGENISVSEVERLLLEHPAVSQVAIVAMPDPVMVERACAFVVPTGSARPTLDELAGFLRERRLALQKLPERLELMDALPTTPSGKVRKTELRAVAAALAAD